jgi:hypothetical protein
MATTNNTNYAAILAAMQNNNPMNTVALPESQKVRDVVTERIDALDAKFAGIDAVMREMVSQLSRINASQIPAVNFVPAPAVTVSAPMISTPTGIPGKLSYADFYRRAIVEIRKKNTPYNDNGDVSKGIHAVISGFNEYFRQYYGENTDVKAVTEMMIQQNIITSRMVRRGPMLYLHEDSYQQAKPVVKPVLTVVNGLPTFN